MQKKLQRGGGSGLGLWICRVIVKKHEGDITFHSNGAGCGTTFSFFLDAYSTRSRENSDSVAVPIDECPDELSNHSLDSLAETVKVFPHPCVARVMVVDDLALNRKILSRMLFRIAQTSPEISRYSIVFEIMEADDGVQHSWNQEQ